MVMRERGDAAFFPGLVIEVETSTSRHRFEKADLVENAVLSGRLETPTFSVPETGPLEVRVSLSAQGQMIASGTVRFELREGFEWDVGVWRTDSGIFENCFTCMGQELFPIEEEFQNVPGEQLLITWAGRPVGPDVQTMRYDDHTPGPTVTNRLAVAWLGWLTELGADGG